MKALYFSPEQIRCAKEISTGDVSLFPAAFVAWAEKVLRWAREFRTVLRLYCEELRHAALAVKAIFQNLKNGISIRHMLRTYRRTVSRKRWQRNKGTQDVQLCNPKTNKHELRAKRMRQTDSYQINGQPFYAQKLVR